MPTINLELQLKFLRDLDAALDDALKAYKDDGPEKLAELTHMKSEVARARTVVSERLSSNKADKASASRRYESEETLQQAAFG